MKKAVVDQFRPGSSIWIVAHGLYQESRGRKPSVSVMGWCHKTRSRRRLDPSETLARALKDVTQGGVGKYLGGHVIEMVAAANLLRRPIECNWGYGQVILVNPGDTAETIMTAFRAESEARRQAYWASEEGIAYAQELAEEEQRAAAARAEPLKIFTLTPDSTLWQTALHEAESNSPVNEAVRYAARWANLMETTIAGGASLEDIADDTSYEAAVEGIAGSWIPWVIHLLSKSWIHGEQLRQWHNLKHGGSDQGQAANDAGGVLCPNIITVPAE